MLPLTYEENKSCKKQKFYHILQKQSNAGKNDGEAFKLCNKLWDHYHYNGKYRGAAHNVWYKTPKYITIVFHNGCT